MSTNSTIALAYADGHLEQIYCHSDGYPSHNGYLLKNYYSDPLKVAQLMMHGDMSVLGKDIGVQISFDDPMEYCPEHFPVQCRFYKRDRQEAGTEAARFANIDEFLQNAPRLEYNYLLRAGKWYCNLYELTDSLTHFRY